MTKGCYTCRRRRIICDNALPTCQKCRDAGKECLGYQKPLVWVKGGVASRGKMMGRSFNDTTKKSARRTGNSNGSTAVSSDNVLTASTINDNHHTGPGTPLIATVQDDGSVAPVVQSSYKTVQPEKDNASSSSSDNATVTEQTPLPFGLIDPTLKDMNELSRFYIFHFNQKTADDFVLYTNTQNPYRGLISLVGESPLLANALSATGAVHYALLSNSDFSPMPWSSGDPMAAGAPLSAREIEKAIKSSMSRRPSSKVFEHFLGLKQRTLRQLSLDLRDPVKRNDDKTAAATMVLALMDAIESGEEAWKYHLEGAKKLLNNRQQKSDAGTSQEIVGWLDSLTIDGCLLIELMGSTLARPGVLSKPFYTPSMGQTALKRLEKTYWVGCPAYLLEVIFFVHARFCHSGADPNAQQPTMVFSSSFLPKNSEPLKSPEAFLQHIQAFDPTAWAVELQTVLFLPDLTMRIALASTYKAAVYLYASRVISRPRLGSISVRPSWFGLPPDHDAVAQFLIQQLSVIPPRDQHFKCLIWPTFIAGAECRDAAHRPFILDRLSTLYYAIATVNVRNAAWVLSMMWQKQDLKREQSGNRKWLEKGVDPALDPSPGFGFDPGPGHGTENVPHPPPSDNNDFDWIQELDESRIDWLFI